MRAPGATARAILLVVLGVAALTGCGGGSDQPGGDPSASSAGPTADPSGDVSEETDVEPASGDEVVTDHLTLRLPTGWRLRQLTDAVQVAEPKPLDGSSLTIFDYDLPGDPVSLEVLARREARKAVAPPAPPLDVMDPIEVGGVEVFHVGGMENAAQYFDEYGAAVDDARVSLEFSLPVLTPRAERRELIESVLASVEWNL